MWYNSPRLLCYLSFWLDVFQWILLLRKKFQFGSFCFELLIIHRQGSILGTPSLKYLVLPVNIIFCNFCSKNVQIKHMFTLWDVTGSKCFLSWSHLTRDEMRPPPCSGIPQSSYKPPTSPYSLPPILTPNYIVSGRFWQKRYYMIVALGCFFWERLGTKSFLFSYPRNEKRKKSFPLYLPPPSPLGIT